jgi:hypothetical protein
VSTLQEIMQEIIETLRERRKMKNVKNHAKLRYAQRVLGMSDEKEIKQYLAQNDQLVIDHINKMVDNSHFIYRGQIGDNTTKIFRIADNYILVLDSQETCVITLYKCYFDFGEKTDRFIIQQEMIMLDELHQELKNIDAEIDAFIEIKTVETSTLEQQIKALEEQVRMMKIRKTTCDEEVKGKRAVREFSLKEIEKRAVRLCNSIEYRKDLQSGA